MTHARILLATLLLAAGFTASAIAAESRPNVVYILCDDLGYGDVKYLNPQGKIPTPRLDRLASEGMVFTDAHSGSSVCTPTRYGIMTGRYSWRTKLQQGVLLGYSPLLIEPGRRTVASLLKSHGYATAAVGKWHLGIGQQATDYAKPLTYGPNSVGFDEYFGIAASLDMPPYVFIRNETITAPLTGKVENSPVPKYWRAGPIAEGFQFEEVLPQFAAQASAFIAKQKPGQPFFLYLPLASPHTPIVPKSPWLGKSGLNAYADFVMQNDHCIGQVLDALEQAGVAENTLVILTSDNGCSPAAGFEELVAKGHNPSYHFRGHKADIYDGGHRMPFIARWPAKVKAGSKSDQLICHTDLLATCAELVGAKLPADTAEDSASILPALLGTATSPLHEAVVHHSANGAFAIRQGRWKLEFCPGSGGWSFPRPGKDDTSKLPKVQLYDMVDDVGETKNVESEHADIVAQLTKLLEKYVADGRSTPGAQQQNDVPVDIWRGVKQAASKKAKKAKPTEK